MIESIKKVNEAFDKANIYASLETALRDNNSAVKLMESLQKISISVSNFNKNEREILSILDLANLIDPKIWTLMLSPEKADARGINHEIYRNLIFAKNHLPKIMRLIQQEGVENFNNNTKKQSENSSQEILTIILPEDYNHLSSPDRLIEALTSIKLFYKVCAFILGESENELGILAIDSGSDKSFDFLGAAKVIESVKEIIFGLYDRVVFHKEKKAHEKLDLISKSLPIIEKIQDLKDSGKIDAEQCEILKREIFGGTQKFLDAGAILTEFTEMSIKNPRELMSPEPKLLMVGKSKITSEESVIVENNIEEDSNDELSEEEKALLKKLVSKEAKKSKSKK